MDIKSVIRDYLLRNYVVNVYSFKTCKLSKYNIEIFEDLILAVFILRTNLTADELNE